MSNIIDELNAQFLNNVVEVTERKFTPGFKHLGRTFEFTEYNIASSDSTIASLAVAVNAKGYRLHVLMPNSFAAKDYCADRVNAFVRKGDDGKFRIAHLRIG